MSQKSGAKRKPDSKRSASVIAGGTVGTPGGNGYTREPESGMAIPFAVPTTTSPQPVQINKDHSQPGLYFNRELSWLDFNWRVLYQALDRRVPLLERVRFLSIAASNLDEFFRKRVGGLKRQEAVGVRVLSPDGRTPSEQLERVGKAVRPMHDVLIDTWENKLKPELADVAGVVIHNYQDLSSEQQAELYDYFMSNIYPILTPLAVDPGHPFPFISNLSLSLAVIVRHPVRRSQHFARLKVPIQRGRWVPVEGHPHHFIPIEQVIAHNVGALFRGMDIVSVHAFRITRNADLSRNEEEADDLLAMISEEVRERRFATVVRLEVEKTMPAHTRQLLMEELELEEHDVYEVDGLLEISDCGNLANLPLPDFQYPPWEPVVPQNLQRQEIGDESIFSVIQRGDILVHHPYESFSASVGRFIEEASVDPKVLAIKQTLYRTSDDSSVIHSLVRAAESGKQVAVLVEVKARFDEENNILWAQLLEKAGVHVTYGLVGLKTHTKTALVVREEEDGIRTYYHVGTGNYNVKTAKLYTDMGYLSCKPDMGLDLVNLFHHLTGYAPEQQYRKLLVAPNAMRNIFLDHINREIEHQQAYGNGYIIGKMNALDDIETIQALYSASKAGVQIDLIVRGHCRLRPGLEHYSENIRVISIIGRFLEHSRVYHFNNNGTPTTYIGSADWQRRNLEDRVEAIAPIEEPVLQERITDELKLALSDNRLAWDLQPDGKYIQRKPAAGEPERNLHELLMQKALNEHLL